MLNSALLNIIEESGMGVLTLTETIEEDEFLRSRLTRQEVRRLTAAMAKAINSLPEATRARLPELDWEGWGVLARQLDQGPEAEGTALWFASRALIPATLTWLRIYRTNEPDLFAFTEG